MKKLVILSALLFASCFASATDVTASTDTAQNQQSNSSAVVSCLINCADQTSSAQISADASRDVAKINGDAKIRNTPSVSGPALTSSNDTCMGSSSGSANAPGIGVSFGTTWDDTHCKRLKGSRELWNKGMKAASLALDCMDPDMHAALTMTGYMCPQDQPKESTSAAVSQEKYTDPIVRERLGMAPLVAAK